MTFFSKKPFGANIVDVIFSICICVLSICSVWFINRSNSDGDKRALQYQDGKLIREYDLSKKDDEYFDFNNTIVEVKGGKIRIEKNDCPNGQCVHKGWISHSSETIVCIPKRIIIEIVEPQNGQGFNAITY